MPYAGLQATDGVPIPLRGVRIEGEVVGGYAHIRIRQRYQNTEGKPVEAVYTFPMPADATLAGFAMECHGRRLDGLIKEREEAFRQYDDALTAGHGGALLEQERPNVFTASVGNLLPGEETVVEVGYAQRLQANGGALRCMIPTLVAPRYIPGTPTGDRTSAGWAAPTDRVPDADRITPCMGAVEYSLTLALLFDLGRDMTIESPSHALRLEHEEGMRVRVSFAHDEVALDRDIVLIARGAVDETLSTVVLHQPLNGADADDPGVLALTIVPDSAVSQAQDTRQDVIFVMDVSGSMVGASIDAAKAALRSCLRHLRAGDRFNLVAFQSSYTVFASQPLQFSQTTLALADTWIEELHAGGGTELLTPLQEAVRQVPDGVVLLLTDGQVGNEAEILSRVLAGRKRTRMYTFGIGTVVSDVLLRALAQRTGGAVEFIYPGESLLEKVESQFARAIAPRITEVRVSFTGENCTVMEQAPAELPDLVVGEPWIVFARFSGRGTGRAEIQGQLGTAPFALSVPIDYSQASPRPLLAKCWATERIRDWEFAAIAERRTKRMKERIIELAVQHGIPSRYTAFLVIEQRTGERRVNGQPETRFIPVHVPAGWAMFDPRAAAPESGGVTMHQRAGRGLRAQLLSARTQAPVLAPLLHQAMAVSQLQRDDLEALINKALNENPFLERVEEPTSVLEHMPSPATSLANRLAEQLRLKSLTPEEERVASILIGNLDVDGYLQASLAELAAQAHASVQLTASVLQLIQACAPPGVGAVDLRECWLLQLRTQVSGDRSHENPVLPLAVDIVRDHFALLTAKRIDRLLKELRVTVEEVSQAMHIIASLDPKPGRLVSTPSGSQVRPDVEVRKEGQAFVARLNEKGFPRLRVNAAYGRTLTKDGEVKTAMPDKLRSAKWLIKSIKQSRRTLLQVAQSIVTFQHDFLSDGVSPIQPLAVQDVADAADLHVSTVSRAIANKYMATPWGIFPMEKFCRMSGHDASSV